MAKRYITVFCILWIMLITGFSQVTPGFKVVGRQLHDYCGDEVILRGVNYPNAWFQLSGLPHYEEIEKTGANVIRIVWETNKSAADLDIAITNCRDLNMIPMPELHDATGDLSKLQTCVDYWTSSEVVNVIIKHQEYLLINIANEAGAWEVTKTQFLNAYQSAVSQMRTAGIHVPLIIDGSDWGKNLDILQSEGPALIEADPDHNLMFSIHMWWPKKYGFTESDIVNGISESVAMGLPLIVGEFSQMHGECDENVITAENSIAYKTILRECQKNKIGYIAWSWFGNCNSNWDMTTDGEFDNLYDWGIEVAVTDENSIKNTSARPYSWVHGICNPEGIENSYAHPGFTLKQNSPNPFSLTTTIEYSLQHQAYVKLSVFNIIGEEIKTLVSSEQEMGEHSLFFDAEDLKPGIYYYSIRVDKYQESMKMVIL